MPVNFEAIGTIAVLQNRSYSSYTFLRRRTTTKNYFRTGHETQEIVSFSITTPFYDTEPT